MYDTSTLSFCSHPPRHARWSTQRSVTLHLNQPSLSPPPPATQADQLRETVWSVLPSIFRSLGKRAAKQHLELFQPQLTETLASPSASQLARHASAQCLHAIAELIGPSILLNRLPARYHDVYLSACGNSAHRPAGQGEESAAVAAFPELRNRPSLVSI